MSATSSIEWTEKTWNPVRGCSVISPGCVNCYAMKQAHRFSLRQDLPFYGLTKQTKAGPQWTGVVRTVPGALLEPLSWRKPQRVFVNSMSDLFHEEVPDAFIDQVFAVMALASRHTFQVLTKRAERMRAYVLSRSEGIYRGSTYTFIEERLHAGAVLAGAEIWPLGNVWLGVSVEDQKHAHLRIPLLLQTPASVRFISAEPLLGPLNFRHCGGVGWCLCQGAEPYVHKHYQDPPQRCARCLECKAYTGLDWVIVGGESGPGARPFDLAWARSIVQQCKAAGVACFVKQLGANAASDADGIAMGWVGRGNIWHPLPRGVSALDARRLKDRKGGDPSEWPEDLRVREFPL